MVSSSSQLAKYSDPGTIAHWMNDYLNSQGITAKAVLKNKCLGILLESNPAPSQDEMIAFVRTSLNELNWQFIRKVKVYGRQSGERLPAWQHKFKVGTREELLPRQVQVAVETVADDSSSISDWLSQGQTVVQLETVEEAIPPDSEVEKFLRFQFSPEITALLPLASVKEMLRIPVEEILPVPDMPDCVLGIHNCRGEMLWLVDLDIQIGLFSLKQNTLDSQLLALPTSNVLTKSLALLLEEASGRTLTAIAIEADDKSVGIVVPQVVDIEVHKPEALQTPSPGLFHPGLLPFIQGYLTSSSSPVLDAKALIQDSQLQIYRLN